MRALTLILCAVALSSCMASKEIAEKQAAADDAQCKSFGLTFGTPAYAECRIRLTEGRERSAAAARAALLAEPTATNCQTYHGTTTCQSY